MAGRHRCANEPTRRRRRGKGIDGVTAPAAAGRPSRRTGRESKGLLRCAVRRDRAPCPYPRPDRWQALAVHAFKRTNFGVTVRSMSSTAPLRVLLVEDSALL